jgi:hypothetical protein
MAAKRARAQACAPTPLGCKSVSLDYYIKLSFFLHPFSCIHLSIRTLVDGGEGGGRWAK